jgi:tRNA(Phe) wybutosine-synthesizing methylase Tyw3
MDMIDVETANTIAATHFLTVENMSKLLRKLNTQLATAHAEIEQLKEELCECKKTRAKYTKTVDSQRK